MELDNVRPRFRVESLNAERLPTLRNVDRKRHSAGFVGVAALVPGEERPKISHGADKQPCVGFIGVRIRICYEELPEDILLPLQSGIVRKDLWIFFRSGQYQAVRTHYGTFEVACVVLRMVWLGVKDITFFVRLLCLFFAVILFVRLPPIP